MPFDQSDYVVALPQVAQPVTDDLLRWLIAGRAKMLEPGVWVNGPGAGDMQMCAGIAVNRAWKWLGEKEPAGKLATATWDALRHAVPKPFTNVVDYNNRRDATLEEMVAVVDRAIATRRAEIG